MRHTANRPTLLASTDDITFPLVYDRRLPLPQQQCMQDDCVGESQTQPQLSYQPCIKAECCIDAGSACSASGELHRFFSVSRLMIRLMFSSTLETFEGSHGQRLPKIYYPFFEMLTLDLD